MGCDAKESKGLNELADTAMDNGALQVLPPVNAMGKLVWTAGSGATWRGACSACPDAKDSWRGSPGDMRASSCHCNRSDVLM